MLNFINSLPNGLIVMMAAWDTGSVCRTGCQTAMELVGGSGIPNGHRGKFFGSFDENLKEPMLVMMNGVLSPLALLLAWAYVGCPPESSFKNTETH